MIKKLRAGVIYAGCSALLATFYIIALLVFMTRAAKQSLL